MLTGIYQKIKSLRAKFLSVSRTRRAVFLAIVFVVILAGVLTPAHFANAYSLIGSIMLWTGETLMGWLTWILVLFAGFFLKMSLFILKFVIELAGYNGYLDSPAVEVGWVMVRDLTNMFFVVILLAIAFGTILGIEQYEWKKLLVKFVLVAVLVNFSRIICGVIIDIAQVVMMTFVNGVAATAGGNLIQAFSMDSILNLSKQALPEEVSDPGGVFIGAVAALAFSAMLMVMMGVYLFILLARMITLWILIVLSPIAFVTSILPQTQKYAQEWWKEFNGHVIAGPLAIFFIWLAFVTVGSGNIHDQIIAGNTMEEAKMESLTTMGGIGIGHATTWANMANFFIAIGMLFVGAKKTQELGVSGGSAMSKVGDFGKKVAMIASGYAAGRWMAGGAAKLAVKGAKAAAWNMPLVGGEKWKLRFQNEWENVKNAYYGKAAGLSKKGIEASLNVDKFTTELEQLRGEREKLIKAGKSTTNIDREIGEKETGLAAAEQLKQQETTGGGVIGWFARAGLAEEKRLGKSKSQGEIRKKMAFKRISGESGGVLFNRVSSQVKDSYRYEKGMLEAEEERSATKDKQFAAMGKMATLREDRFRDGHFLRDRGPMAEQITGQKERAAATDEQIKDLFAKARQNFYKNPASLETDGGERYLSAERTLKAKITAELKTKESETEMKAYEGGARRGFIRDESLGRKLLLTLKTWEARQKRGETKTKEEETKAEREFAESEKGMTWQRDIKKAELGTKVAAGAIVRVETEAEQALFAEGGVSVEERGQIKTYSADDMKQMLQDVNIAEQAKKAAATYTEVIKDDILSEAFKASRAKIDKIIQEWKEGKTGNTELLTAAMAGAGLNDEYINAMRAAEIARVSVREKKLTETQAVDSAANAVVEIQRGREIPSDANDVLIEESQKAYANQERADGAQKTADTMFFLMHRQDQLKAGGKELAVVEQAELAGAFGKIDTESWNDDFADYMARMLERLDRGELTGQGQKEIIAKQMKKMADATGMKFGIDKKTGKYKFAKGYDRRMSAMLQAHAITGGDTTLWTAHDKISQWQKTHTAEEYKTKGGYWGVAEELAKSSNLGYSSTDEMKKAYRHHQDKIKYAAKRFKANGLNNGHYESVLNQEYDDTVDIFRFNTEMDATSGTITEMSKRPASEILRAQAHSIIRLGLHDGTAEAVIPEMFAAVTAQLKNDLEARQIGARTLVKTLGGHESETKLRTRELTETVEVEIEMKDPKTGKKVKKKVKKTIPRITHMLGGEKKKQTFLEGAATDAEKAERLKELDTHLVQDILVPMIEGNEVGAALWMQRATGSSHEDATHGVLNLSFDGGLGGADGIKDVAQLVKIIEEDRARFTNISNDTFALLKRRVEQYKVGVLEKRRESARDRQRNAEMLSTD